MSRKKKPAPLFVRMLSLIGEWGLMPFLLETLAMSVLPLLLSKLFAPPVPQNYVGPEERGPRKMLIALALAGYVLFIFATVLLVKVALRWIP